VIRVPLLLAAVALCCSACVGSAGRPPAGTPTAFEVTYVRPIGNIAPPNPPPPPPPRLVRCGRRNRALCAAIAYYVTHGPRTCDQSFWSTPAQFGVKGMLRGRRIDEPVAPICRRSPRGLARAERVMFDAFSRRPSASA
jgi:hypothetical protein